MTTGVVHIHEGLSKYMMTDVKRNDRVEFVSKETFTSVIERNTKQDYILERMEIFLDVFYP